LLPELLLDFEDPLERLEPDETERAGEELLEPELDRVTLDGLLDLLLPVDLERVTDDFLDPELDLVTLDVLPERVPLDERVLETEELLPESELRP
jgi:hypothetical protein